MSDESTDETGTTSEQEPSGTDSDTPVTEVTGGAERTSQGTEPARASPGADEVFCRNCGAVISEDAEICPDCGVRQRDPPSNSVESLLEDLTEGGNPFVAAGLSVVFPGLGQLYNRELQKAILVMVASLIALASMLAFVGLVLYPAVWLYAIYDAYVVADRQSKGKEEDGDGTD